MKRKSIEKVLAVVMAASVAMTPMSSVSFAAEEDAVNANTVTQEEQVSEPAKEQQAEKSVEKSASSASESSAPAAEESAAPAENSVSAAAVPAEEQVQEEVQKPAKSSYKVKIVLDGVMTASGPSSVTAVSSVTINAGATKTYSATTVNGWVKTKSVKYDGVTYKYASALTDASGNTVTSVTIKAEDLDDDTTLTFRPVYTEVADMHVVVNFNNIMKANGEVISSTEQNTLSTGSGWNFSQKKLDNKVVAKSFSYKGVNYKYSGKWVDENGNEFSSLSVKNNGETKEVVYNISPVYDKTYPEVLDFRYIDNISTGSGSWKNIDGAFTTFSHKFKEPEGQKHYKFVEWKNLESGESFQQGDTFKYTAKANLPEETVTSVNVYALWQPSVTVEYYSNGVLAKSVESTDSALAAYDYNAADTEEVAGGADFDGWYESAEDGAARVEEDKAYDLPEITAEPVEQKIVKLYAKYTVDYTVEHYTENSNGSFKLAESEVKGAALGTDVSAEAKEFEGFTFNKEIEGTLTEAKAAKGLTLKLYYNRNSSEAANEVVPAAPAKPAGKVTANTPAANAQTQQINASTAPQAAAPTVINDNETPLAQTGVWALINLICAAATALLSLIMLAVYFGKRRNEDEQIEEENVSKVRIASMIPAIGAIIAFILTENMSLPMAMVDKWTVLMIAILAIQAGVGLFAKLRDNEENEQENESRA